MQNRKEFTVDRLTVKISDTRAEMGALAAAEIRKTMLALLAEREEIHMIFAAAPSQNEVLASLLTYTDIPWDRVRAFHMDEYIGLPHGDSRTFGYYLNEHVFGKLPFRSVNLIDGSAKDIDAERARYATLLKENPCDIVMMGIGENGHIAFNDPGVADFNDPEVIKVAELDLVCRTQQVHDGCFPTLDDVPTHALTLTCPTLMGAKYQFCVVPTTNKACAVKRMLTGEIDDECPATCLRRAEHATLYLDADSASLL